MNDGLTREFVRRALDRASEGLRERRNALERRARASLERETLGAEELAALAGDPGRWAVATGAGNGDGHAF